VTTQLSTLPVFPQYCRWTRAVLSPFLGWPLSSTMPTAFGSAWSRRTIARTRSRALPWSQSLSDRNSWSVRGGTPARSAIGSTLLRGRSLNCPVT